MSASYTLSVTSYSSYPLDLQRDIPTLSLDAAHSDLGYGSDARSVQWLEVSG